MGQVGRGAHPRRAPLEPAEVSLPTPSTSTEAETLPRD